jgi:hypothetical protein
MQRLALIGVPLLAAAGCSAPATQAQDALSVHGTRQCFWASQVTGLSDAGPDRAVVRIGFRETWELTLSPGCPDVDWAMKIGIVSHGGERICTDRPAELIVPSASGSSSRCLVRSIRKLSPAEAAAVWSDRPK